MRRSTPSLLTVSSIAVFCALHGCSSDESSKGSPDGSDAGNDASPPALRDSGADRDDDAPPGVTNTLHISVETGNDANDGRDPTRPLKTIAAALARREAPGEAIYELHLCRGVYKGPPIIMPNVLTKPLTIRGGYDCSTFRRPSETGGFDPAMESRIENADLASGTPTITLAGKFVRSSTILDRIAVAGAATGDRGSIGIEIKDSAAPLISDSVIMGGGAKGAAGGTGSIGVRIVDSEPEIARSKIDGGSGAPGGATPDDFASIGIHVVSGAPNIHDTVVDGGTGRGRVAGIVLDHGADLRGEKALRRDVFTWAAATESGFGILARQALFDVIESDIIGADVACTAGKPCEAKGVALRRGASQVIVQSRIYGGDLSGPASSYGIAAVDYEGSYSAGGRFEGNIIHSGNARRGPYPTYGLHLRWPHTAVKNNTIIASQGSAKNAFAILFDAGAQSIVIDNNLIVSGGGAALRMKGLGCASPPGGPSSLKGNAFVGIAPPLAEILETQNCTSTGTLATIGQLEQRLSGIASSNVRLAASCTGEAAGDCATVAACSTADGCAAAVLEPWDAATGGRKDLFSPTFKLRSTTPCLITKGAVNVPSTSVDVLGAPRTDPASIGAFESDGACAP